MVPLEADQILAALERNEVRYILIGGLAAILHGSPQITFDADICPAKDTRNLEALASALRELEARIRTPDTPGGLRFACDAAFLGNVQLLNLVTKFGELDISFVPSGTAGYADLREHAIPVTLGGVTTQVAALASGQVCRITRPSSAAAARRLTAAAAAATAAAAARAAPTPSRSSRRSRSSA